MECCLLCLDLNKELLDHIETNSKRWQALGITNVLEKHFWPLNNIQQPCSWICLSCWQEVDNFHKFYLRIEEAHMNFGRIKLEQEKESSDSKDEISEEIKDLSYYLEPEILIDQSEVDFNEFTTKQPGDVINESSIISTDPLQKPIVSRRKNRAKSSITIKSELNAEFPEFKKEACDSDDNSYDYANGKDSDVNYEPDKNSIEYKNLKAVDKFIAENFKQMSCDLCNVELENFTAMKKHFLIIHFTPRGYLVCCNRKFYQRSPLVDHLKCHLDPDYFKCTQCGKVLSDRQYLQSHMQHMHRPENVAPKHGCEICGKSFTTARILRTHKLKHLPKEEKNFPCTQCGKFYASSYLLKLHTEVIHLQKHSKVCHICGKNLRTSTEYKAHMNKHAGTDGPSLNCDVCGLRLISERSLKLHKDSQHPVGGKQDHPCPICEKVSPTARALKKHINTMHEKGFDHKCSMCDKAFRRAETLKEHMASHTGTPLYSCPWCPKTFNSNGNMHAHRKNKHPKECLELKMQRYN